MLFIVKPRFISDLPPVCPSLLWGGFAPPIQSAIDVTVCVPIGPQRGSGIPACRDSEDLLFGRSLNISTVTGAPFNKVGSGSGYRPVIIRARNRARQKLAAGPSIVDHDCLRSNIGADNAALRSGS
jgi:hypothetical protein